MKSYAWILAGIFVVLSALAAAGQVPGDPASVADWFGGIAITGNTSPNGALVFSFINGSSTAHSNATLGQLASGWYLIHVAAGAGSNITFKVFDISAYPTNNSPQNWTQVGNSTYLNLTADPFANSVACNYAGSCSSGFCVDGYCCNSVCSGSSQDCNVAGAVGTCTSTSSSSGGGSSGGGGGGSGGGAPEPPPERPPEPPPTTPPEAPVTESTTVPEIDPNAPASVDRGTPTDQIGIDGITVETSSSVQGAQVTVAAQNSAPASVSGNIPPATEQYPGGGTVDVKVYKYITFTTNVPEAVIKKATITFDVVQSWVIANNIDPNTVRLLRNEGGVWKVLKTTLVSFDEAAGLYSYSADSPGFSVFAITGQEKIGVCAAGAKACTGEVVQVCRSDGTGWETAETCPYGCLNGACIPAPAVPRQEIPWLWAGAGIVAVLVVGFVAFRMHGKPRKK